MTDKEIKAEAEKYYEKFKLICTDPKESFINGFQLGYRDGQIKGMITAMNPNK